MRTLTCLSLTALAALLGACSDAANPLAPGPSFELVDADLRVDAEKVNAWVYGSFVIEVVGTAGGVITSGPANFPGSPKGGPGTCEDGKWINSQGKPTSGSLTRAHPHCIGEAAGTVSIILEPISAENKEPGGSGNESLNLAEEDADGRVAFVGQGGPNAPGTTTGSGIIVAWAIDASTLQSTKTRVGKITIDLNQYDTNNADLFENPCTIGDDNTVRCLNKLIDANYQPLPAPDGLGSAQTVTGFLYWEVATEPFNYVD